VGSNDVDIESEAEMTRKCSNGCVDTFESSWGSFLTELVGSLVIFRIANRVEMAFQQAVAGLDEGYYLRVIRSRRLPPLTIAPRTYGSL